MHVHVLDIFRKTPPITNHFVTDNKAFPRLYAAEAETPVNNS